ncbi:hypothetical protein Rsub_01137 [Raphidocelis subcapitata]|uniref:alpha-1,2-Mannosidase n=1 Tax=Raphidocelis subcapitata TaxID=307507 RepID=A0A2V0NUC3_9CHLO|nr:hypothetical protein Rsub_01137 [Raphidocelis subcapitata]|eukprot:GBF88425.1 hypothetical protein Rsub_01137 [Raphidocelis subcapitata]
MPEVQWDLPWPIHSAWGAALPRRQRGRRAAAAPAVLLLLLLAVAGGAAAKKPAKPTTGPQLARTVWRRHRTLGRADLQRLRDEAGEAFDFGLACYMRHAFPRDNLLPLSCGGADWQGGMALTLIDALDALVVLGRGAEFGDAVGRLVGVVDFGAIDEEVHVFEVSIRALGGLVSAHFLAARNPGLVPGGYKGQLLALAVDLADRLMPAFKTPTGLPAAFVNLKRGTVRPRDNSTCTACAGTLLLEFGALSALTGNATYLRRAQAAADAIYRRRSPLGLVGSHLATGSGAWVGADATIGPAGDSYYEYLLKAYLMTGRRSHLAAFAELYASAMAAMRLPAPVGGPRVAASFLLDVQMHTGRLARPFVSSLGAFWPATQALAGQEQDARALHSNYTAAWRAFGWLPELFAFDLSGFSPSDGGYNLRPEHAESTFMLHALTGEPSYLGVAAGMLEALRPARARCGYAAIASVATGEREDLMESYFLSETARYLFLTFSDGAAALPDWFVLSTEGHLLPVLPGPDDDGSEGGCDAGGGGGGGGGAASGGCWAAPAGRDELSALEEGEGEAEGAGGGDAPSSSGEEGAAGPGAAAAAEAAAADGCRPANATGAAGLGAAAAAAEGGGAAVNATAARPAAAAAAPGAGRAVPEACRRLCARATPAELLASRRRLQAALPLVGLAGHAADARRLARRRCEACIVVTEAMAAAAAPPAAERLSRLAFGGSGGRDARDGRGAVLAAAVCSVEVTAPWRGRGPPAVRCGSVRPLGALDAAHGLPAGAVVLQLSRGGGQEPFEEEGEEPADPLPHTLLVAVESEDGPATLRIDAATAAFGPRAPRVGARCLRRLAAPAARAWAQPPRCPPAWPPAAGPAGRCPSAARCEELFARHAAQAPQAAVVAPPAQQQQQQQQEGKQQQAGEPEQQQEQQQQQQRQQREPLLAADAADALACTGYDPCAPDAPGSWLPEAALNAGDARAAPCGRARALPALRLARPDPPDGCSPPRNAAALRGAIALAVRGGCSFVDKALALQEAGAAAVVVVNLFEGGGLLSMAGDGTGREPGIPAVVVSQRDGEALAWWMQRRPLLGTLVRGGSSDGGGGGRDGGSQQQQKQQETRQQEQREQRHNEPPPSKEQQQQPAPPGDAPRPPLRVDALLPVQTNLWLVERLGLRAAKAPASAAAAAVNDALHALMRDPHALRLLEGEAGLDLSSLAATARAGASGGGGGGGRGKDKKP